MKYTRHTHRHWSLVILLVQLLSLDTATAQTLPLQEAACPPAINNGRHCTANSMRVTAVSAEPERTSCDAGERFNLRVGVTVGTGQNRAAKERYDLGYWVAQSGGTAIGGTRCAFSALLPATDGVDFNLSAGDGPYRAINANRCGDIVDAELTYHEFVVNDVVCQDSNANGKLDIPLAVGWQQSKNNNGCAVVTDPNDALQVSAFVSSLFPQTSSSCWDNGGAPVDIDEITVEPPPEIEVYKTATPRFIRGDAGVITFEVEVFNESDRTDELTITSLTDDQFGDLAGVGNCALGSRLAAGARYRCEFQKTLRGSPGDIHQNTVSATATDDAGLEISDSDSARVVFLPATDPPTPDIRVIKTASPHSIDEPGGPVVYQVEVWNDGETELELVTLDDSRVGGEGSLQNVGSCALPQSIPIGLSYSCEYTLSINGRYPDTHTNTVTAVATNPADGQQVSDTDTAVVTFRETPAVLTMKKLPRPAVIQDRTAVTYELVVENHSPAKTITITSLVDSYHGDITALGLDCGEVSVGPPLVLSLPPAGSTIECTFSGIVPEANEPLPTEISYFPDTVTASGTADDGSAVSASATAEVQFVPPGSVTPPAPIIEVVKRAIPDRVPTTGGNVVFSVEVINASLSESVLIDGLNDDVHGNLSARGTCAEISVAAPLEIAAGDQYRCTFTESLTGAIGSIERDTVVAVGTGADSNTAVIGFDTAAVLFEGVPLDITVSKTPSQTLIDPGAEITFTVEVSNNNDFSVEILELTDSVFGDLTGVGTCTTPITIASGTSAECRFDKAVNPNVRPRVHNNVVTVIAQAAGLSRSDSRSVSATDQAWVLFTAALADIPVPVPTLPHGLLLAVGILGIAWLRRRHMRR
jgi:hypothetical protein